jgi:hypothetical protein
MLSSKIVTTRWILIICRFKIVDIELIYIASKKKNRTNLHEKTIDKLDKTLSKNML